MELLKKLSKTVSSAVDYTVRKTGEVTDIARLKLQRARTAETVNDAYTRIGRLVYRQYRDDSDHTEQIAALCMSIDEGNAEMKRIADSIEGIKLLAKMKAEKSAPVEEVDALEDIPCEEIFDTEDIAF